MQPKADIRTIIQVGGSLAITLPMEYVKTHNIKIGDSIYILYNDYIYIKPINKEELAKKVEKAKELLESE